MPHSDPISDVRNWQAQSVKDNAFDCVPINFEDSAEWRFEGGQLRHRTGGWFSVAGIRSEARHPLLNGRQQLIILQRQIAINGFLVQTGAAGVKLLFQGRVEPGNIHGMQLAPTVQSTESNYKRLHGGKATPFVEFFLDPTLGEILFDELQSEEATRYFGKYNRNIMVRLTSPPPAPDGFRWYDMEAIRRFVVYSNVLNTDARSVLASANWDVLAGEARPFTHHPAGSFGAELRASYDAPLQHADALDTLAWLTRLRVRTGLHSQILPIDALENWVIERNRIREVQADLGFQVRQFKVIALGREVGFWDQPLIDSFGVGRLTLVCQQRAGMLRFLVKASHEIGFLEGVQLGASIFIPPGRTEKNGDAVEQRLLEAVSDDRKATLLHRCRQSEEGGRFYQDEVDYEMVLLDPSVTLPEPEDYRWLTLSEIRELIAIPGVFSMEFRGVLALLLAYL